MKKCKVGWCKNPLGISSGKGFCRPHYQRFRNGTDLDKPFDRRIGSNPKHIGCLVKTCERKHMALGYCQSHYHRFRNGLDLAEPIKIYDRRFKDSFGYTILYVNQKEIFEHRYVMEKNIGRKLKSNEVVHHKNEDRSDNRIENLELMTKGQHIMIHHKNRPKPRKPDFNKVIRTLEDWYGRGSSKK